MRAEVDRHVTTRTRVAAASAECGPALSSTGPTGARRSHLADDVLPDGADIPACLGRRDAPAHDDSFPFPIPMRDAAQREVGGRFLEGRMDVRS